LNMTLMGQGMGRMIQCEVMTLLYLLMISLLSLGDRRGAISRLMGI
jgi:hypothetical protein